MKQRKIKFRAWDKTNKRMLLFTEGFYIDDMDSCGLIFNPYTFYDKEKSYSKEDVILMQFTGIKDRKKKDIYEGDILTSEDGGYEGEVFWDDEEMCYMCGSKDGASNNLAKEDIFYEANVEIKGHIYEDKISRRKE